MKLEKNKMGSMDIVAVMILYLMFAMFVLLTFVTSIRAYQNITNNVQSNYEIRTTLQYISNKIKAYEGSAKIDIKNIDNKDALVITEEIDNKLFNTYIYENEGKLYELFIESGSNVTLGQGDVITNIKDFKLTKLNNNFIKIDTSSEVPLIIKSN